MRPYRDFIVWPIVSAGGAIFWLPALTLVALAPSGPLGVLASLELQYLLTLFLALLVLAASIVGIFFRRFRRRSLVAIVAVICCLLVQPVGLRIALLHVRSFAFDRLAQRSGPLVQAIKRL